MFPFSVPGLFALSSLAAAAAASDSESVSVLEAPNSRAGCYFKLGGLEFDLCPVWKAEPVRTIVSVQQTPPTVTRTTYRISLVGPLKWDKKLPANEQCPGGTWICMTEMNWLPGQRKEAPRLLKIIPVAGNLALGANHTREHHPGLNGRAKLGKTANDVRHAPVDVTLHGGRYVDKNQFALLRFRCNHTVAEPTSPSFQMLWGGFHYFTWDTKHACAKAAASPEPTATSTLRAAPTAQPDPDPEEVTPPSNDDSDWDEKEELLLPETPMNSPRGRSVIAILISICVFGTLGYLIYNSMPRIREFVYRRGKAYRFRVGERRLLHWAQEDLGLDEEDVMVNSTDIEEATEEMPLTPSPRTSSFNRGYGSAG